MRGKFITFEGPDGSGKTTQVKLLMEYLNSLDCPAVATREPGGTNVAEKIRGILLDPNNNGITDRTEVLLYAASRAQHVAELILPALEEGKVVVCDRFIDSTIAYQGFGRNLDLNLLDTVNQMATGGLLPDITILLDLPPQKGLNRIKNLRLGHGDRLEQENMDFHIRVREGYLYLGEKYPERVKVIKASQPAEEVFMCVKSFINNLLKG